MIARQLLVFIAISGILSASETWLDQYEVNEITCGFSNTRASRSISDKPLTVAGTVYRRGIGTHAASGATFGADGKSPLRFRAKVGADDGPQESGSVVFQVFGDDRKLFDSGVLRKGDAARDVDVDLSGVRLIELRVTDAGDGMNCDHADWCEARFIHAGEAPRLMPRWSVVLPHYTGAFPSAPAKATAFSSPNGKVSARVGVSDGRLALEVRRRGKPALDPSPLGITLDGQDLGADAEIGKVETYTTNTTYPNPLGGGNLLDRCKGLRIALRSKPSGVSWTLDVRAYDDGVAWRYLAPGKGVRKFGGEATSFVVPEGSVCWSHHNTVSYEANYVSFPAKGESPSRPVTMPLTVELPGGGFACVTEVDTFGYSGMTLGPRGRMFTGIFEDDPKGFALDGDIATPWRVVIAVDDLDALVNQSIVYNVAPPADPKLFPKGGQSWIQPGRAYWTWGFGQYETARWERIRGYVDDAASLNCRYYVIDDPWREKKMGWHRDGHDEWRSLREICDYAATKSVKIMVWEHWDRIRDLTAREEFFKNLAEAGAVGAKIDFMESESHERLSFYQSCLEIAARRHIMINFHGANKPAGEERAWPNWMTREGIYGMEQGGNVSRTHLAALPFTRFVTGPGDFTPTVFRAGPMGKTTAGSQLATSVVFGSPINHWAESLETYRAQGPEVLDFIRNKPVVWDETRVLPGSRIGETAIIARRSGSSWWVAAINGTDVRVSREISTAFLSDGKWETVTFADVPGDKTKLDIARSSLAKGRPITARMEPGGGFALILKPAR
ncbi:MAG: glycoside hydrolase family 97 catalytic domain-containing protein [Verrucomicrobia bacterium]|nr:glycoside hydrolase family 97 catalytic domain-containing protein [Verrucomicrobiota bacterium]